MQQIRWLVVVAALLLAGSSCHRSAPQVPSNRPTPDKTKQEMLHYNQQRLEAEKALIEAYIDSTGDAFTATDDGFWYCIDTSGKGDTIRGGQTVRYAYSLELLNGTVCETTAGRQAAQLEVGRRQSAKGLDLAFRYLQQDTEARILLPSHLAFGIQGREGIEGWTPVLYRVKIIDIQ